MYLTKPLHFEDGPLFEQSQSTPTGLVPDPKKTKARIDRLLIPIVQGPVPAVPVAFLSSATFWIWAAGLFEACGTLSFNTNCYIQLDLVFVSKGREIVGALIHFLGIGVPLILNTLEQGDVLFHVTKIEDIVYFLNKIIPYLKSEYILAHISDIAHNLPGLHSVPVSPNKQSIFEGAWLSGYIDGGIVLDIFRNDPTARSIRGSIVPRLILLGAPIVISKFVYGVISPWFDVKRVETVNGKLTIKAQAIDFAYKLYNYLLVYPLRSWQYKTYLDYWVESILIIHSKLTYLSHYKRITELYVALTTLLHVSLDYRWQPALGLTPPSWAQVNIWPTSLDYVKEVQETSAGWAIRESGDDFSLVLDKDRQRPHPNTPESAPTAQKSKNYFDRVILPIVNSSYALCITVLESLLYFIGVNAIILVVSLGLFGLIGNILLSLITGGAHIWSELPFVLLIHSTLAPYLCILVVGVIVYVTSHLYSQYVMNLGCYVKHIWIGTNLLNKYTKKTQVNLLSSTSVEPVSSTIVEPACVPNSENKATSSVNGLKV